MKPKQKHIGFGDWKEPKNLKKYLADIIKSRRLTYGKYSQRLEKLFCEKNGVKYAIFCSSGTAAQYASIGVLKNSYPERAAKKKYIICPATTFISAHNVIVANGFEPLYVDVAANYNISYEALENALKAHAKDVFAVMPASLMGRPIDGLRIKELLEVYAPEAFFILDSCENIMSRYDSQYPESHATFTAYSTYISHLLISGATGGFICTNDENLAIKARSYINHGRWDGYLNINDDDNVSEATLRDIAAKRFSFVQPGLNFRNGEVEACFALAMLEDNFEGALKQRQANALEIIEGLRELPLVLPSFTEKEEMRWMMLPIRVNRGDKWDLVHHLEAKKVETRDILPMYHKITEPYFGSMLQFKTNFPMSFDILDKGLYIGCHNLLTPEDIKYIISAFKSYYI